MSGGRFFYLEYRFKEIIDTIEEEIRDNDCHYPNNFSKETIAEFKKAIELIKKAQIYVQRIDYLLEGDDSEDTFHQRLLEDLSPQTKNEKAIKGGQDE